MPNILDEFKRKNSKNKSHASAPKSLYDEPKIRDYTLCKFMEKHAKLPPPTPNDPLNSPFQIWRAFQAPCREDKNRITEGYQNELRKADDVSREAHLQKESAISKIRLQMKSEHINTLVLSAAEQACKTGEIAPIEAAVKLGGNTWTLFCRSLPLVRAIEKGHIQLINYLLECGLDATQGYGYSSPLDIISAYSFIPSAALSKQDQSVLDLFSSKFEKNKIPNVSKIKYPESIGPIHLQGHEDPKIEHVESIGKEVRLEGNENPFFEHKMPGEGECGYHVLGISRDQVARKLLEHVDTVEIRDIAHQEIFQNINDGELVSLREALENDPSTQALWPIYKRYKEAEKENKKEMLDKTRTELLACCKSKPIFEAYVRHYISIPGNSLTLTAGNTTGFLEAIAKLFHFDFEVWTGIDGEPLHCIRYHDQNNEKCIYFRFIEGVSENNKSEGHFNLLAREQILKIDPIKVPNPVNQPQVKQGTSSQQQKQQQSPCQSLKDQESLKQKQSSFLLRSSEALFNQHIEQTAAQQLLLALTADNDLEKAIAHSESVKKALLLGKEFEKINSPYDEDCIKAIIAVQDCAASTYLSPTGKSFSIHRTTIGNGLYETVFSSLKNILPNDHPIHDCFPEDLCLEVAKDLTKNPEPIIQRFEAVLEGKIENFFAPTIIMEELLASKDRLEKSQDKNFVKDEVKKIANNLLIRYFDITSKDPLSFGSDIDLECLAKIYDVKFEKHSHIGVNIINPNGKNLVPIFFSVFQQRYHHLQEFDKALDRESYIHNYIEKGIQAVKIPFSTKALTPPLVALSTAILSVTTFESDPLRSQELIPLIASAFEKARAVSHSLFSEKQKEFSQAIVSEYHKNLRELQVHIKEIENQMNDYQNDMTLQKERLKKIYNQNLDRVELFYQNIIDAGTKEYYRLEDERRKAKKEARREMFESLAVGGAVSLICPYFIASVGLTGVAATVGNAALSGAMYAGFTGGNPLKGVIQGVVPAVFGLSGSIVVKTAMNNEGNILKSTFSIVGGQILGESAFPTVQNFDLSSRNIFYELGRSSMRSFVSEGASSLLRGEKLGPSLLAAGFSATQQFVNGYAGHFGEKMAERTKIKKINETVSKQLPKQPSFYSAGDVIEPVSKKKASKTATQKSEKHLRQEFEDLVLIDRKKKDPGKNIPELLIFSRVRRGRNRSRSVFKKNEDKHNNDFASDYMFERVTHNIANLLCQDPGDTSQQNIILNSRNKSLLFSEDSQNVFNSYGKEATIKLAKKAALKLAKNLASGLQYHLGSKILIYDAATGVYNRTKLSKEQGNGSGIAFNCAMFGQSVELASNYMGTGLVWGTSASIVTASALGGPLTFGFGLLKGGTFLLAGTALVVESSKKAGDITQGVCQFLLKPNIKNE